MTRLEKFINTYNELNYPINYPFKLQYFGEYELLSGYNDTKYEEGIEVCIHTAEDSIKPIFRLTNIYKNEFERDEAEKELIEWFTHLEFKEYKNNYGD